MASNTIKVASTLLATALLTAPPQPPAAAGT